MIEETRKKEQSTLQIGGTEETQGRFQETVIFDQTLDKRVDIYQVLILYSSYSAVYICMSGGGVLCQA